MMACERVCEFMKASNRSGLISMHSLHQGCVISPLKPLLSFAAVLDGILLRFAPNTVLLARLVHLSKGTGELMEDIFTTVRQAVWGHRIAAARRSSEGDGGGC